jgi:hypothetical protein
MFMPVDREELRRAVDAFSDDDFIVAQEILTKQFQVAKNEYLQDKLDLESDLKSEDDEE